MNYKAALVSVFLIIQFLIPACLTSSAGAENKFVKLESDGYIVYVDTGKLNSNIFADASRLDVTQLTFKILPASGCVTYVNLPDGGNILVNTGPVENSQTVKGLLAAEFAEMSFEADFMKVFGWKMRLDWLILTSTLPSSIGGFPMISKSFEIRELIMPSMLTLPKPPKTLQAKITGNRRVDLDQVISPVELEISELTGAAASKNYLVLKFSYQDFSFCFLPDITGKEQGAFLTGNAQFLDSTVIFANFELDADLVSMSNALFIVSRTQNSEFITDGKLLYVKLPGQLQTAFESIIKR